MRIYIYLKIDVKKDMMPLSFESVAKTTSDAIIVAAVVLLSAAPSCRIRALHSVAMCLFTSPMLILLRGCGAICAAMRFGVPDLVPLLQGSWETVRE